MIIWWWDKYVHICKLTKVKHTHCYWTLLQTHTHTGGYGCIWLNSNMKTVSMVLNYNQKGCTYDYRNR